MQERRNGFALALVAIGAVEDGRQQGVEFGIGFAIPSRLDELGNYLLTAGICLGQRRHVRILSLRQGFRRERLP